MRTAYTSLPLRRERVLGAAQAVAERTDVTHSQDLRVNFVEERVMSDVAERVKKIVVEHLGVDESKVTDNASFERLAQWTSHSPGHRPNR